MGFTPRKVHPGDTGQKKYLCSLKQAQVKGAYLHDGQWTSLSPPPNTGSGRVPRSFLSSQSFCVSLKPECPTRNWTSESHRDDSSSLSHGVLPATPAARVPHPCPAASPTTPHPLLPQVPTGGGRFLQLRPQSSPRKPPNIPGPRGFHVC